ncbi:MAG: TetR/AcrR family transcriptional regulator [Actinomycetota bacterium]
MATRRRLSAEARRAQLLSVAREVFVEDGYHGAGMEPIATRAGVTKPVLYQHFESKKELYLALLSEDMSDLQSHVEAAIDEARSNRERIQRGLAAYFEFIEANEGSFHLLFRETLGAEPDFREVIERFRDSIAARIGKIIAEDSLLPVAESELLARGVMGMGESVAQWWLERRSVDKSEVLKDLSELAWRGLSGLPRREPQA